MLDFFIGVPDRLELFGGTHIFITVCFALLAAAIFVFRGRLRAFGHFTAVRRAMAAVLAVNMLLHYASRIALGVWSFEEDLPLHICFVVNFFMIYILLSDNRGGLYRVVYYFTFIGPLPAIIFPDLNYSWQSYTFYQFIISHHLMLLISLYCLFVLGYGTSLKSLFAGLLIGNAYIGAVAVFNLKFGTNYIMMTELPSQLYEVYPFLNALPPIVWLELAGAAAMLASYALTFAARTATRKRDR